MKPDLDKAARSAVEMMIKHDMNELPTYPQRIVQGNPRAAIMSFADIANATGVDRDSFVNTIDPTGGVAAVAVFNTEKGPYYIFVVNRDAPIGRLRFILSAEIGNFVLGHRGILPEDVRLAECIHFARHLCFPRPAIQYCIDHGVPLQERVLAHILGNYGNYIHELQNVQGSSVPAELNRKVKEMLTPYLDNLLALGAIPTEPAPGEPLLDLTSYMEGYED